MVNGELIGSENIALYAVARAVQKTDEVYIRVAYSFGDALKPLVWGCRDGYMIGFWLHFRTRLIVYGRETERGGGYHRPFATCEKKPHF